MYVFISLGYRPKNATAKSYDILYLSISGTASEDIILLTHDNEGAY